MFPRRRVHRSIPRTAACRAVPAVDDFSGWQASGCGGRDDDVTTGYASVGSLRRRSTILVLSHSGRPTAFKLPVKMQRINEIAHALLRAVRREHQHLSVTSAAWQRRVILTNIVSSIEIDRPLGTRGSNVGRYGSREDFGDLVKDPSRLEGRHQVTIEVRFVTDQLLGPCAGVMCAFNGRDRR